MKQPKIIESIWPDKNKKRSSIFLKEFGRLTVLGWNGEYRGHRKLYSCQCECGIHRLILVTRSDLVSGNTRSCGCLKIDVNFESSLIHGHAVEGKVTGIYGSWHNMKSRCSNPNVPAYQYYGALGITYCESWEVFENFRDDMLETWFPKAQLDRKDTNGNYNKDNCQWLTRSENIAKRNRERIGRTI